MVGQVESGGNEIVEENSMPRISDPPIPSIEDDDFRAVFINGRWLVSWKWIDDPELKNKCPLYQPKLNPRMNSKKR